MSASVLVASTGRCDRAGGIARCRTAGVKRRACRWSGPGKVRSAAGGEKSSTVGPFALVNKLSTGCSAGSGFDAATRCVDGAVSYLRFGSGIGSNVYPGGSPRAFRSSAACAISSRNRFPSKTSFLNRFWIYKKSTYHAWKKKPWAFFSLTYHIR